MVGYPHEDEKSLQTKFKNLSANNDKNGCFLHGEELNEHTNLKSLKYAGTEKNNFLLFQQFHSK